MPLDYTVAVFDLDNCLMDARAVGPLFEPAFEAVRQANQGALSPQALDQALQACWFTAFDLVAERHRFTPAMRAAGRHFVEDVRNWKNSVANYAAVYHRLTDKVTG